jgi:hypothetical protein
VLLRATVPGFLAAGTAARPWMGLSAEQALADVAAKSGDLAELVEEAHGGQVGRSQLAGDREVGDARHASCCNPVRSWQGEDW